MAQLRPSSRAIANAPPGFIAQTTTVASGNPEPNSAPIIDMGNGMYVGSGTALLFSQEEFKALRDYAGGPIVILSGKDAKLLTNAENETQSIKEIKSWLPNVRLSDDNWHESYKLMYENTTGEALYTSNRNEKNSVQGVIVVSGDFDQTTWRASTGIKFRDNLFDKETLKATQLLVVAHEAAHINLMINGKSPDEIHADEGALNFQKQHPEFFKGMSRSAQDILGGWRALMTLIEPHPNDPYRHDSAAFCSPDTQNCADKTGFENQFNRAREAVIKQAATLLYQKGLLTGIKLSSSFEHALGKVASYGEYPPKEKDMDRAIADMETLDYTKDNTGLLSKYIKHLGITDSQSSQAKQALENFRKAVVNSETHPADFQKFLQRNGMTLEEVRKFAKQGDIEAAPEHLQNSLKATATEYVYTVRSTGQIAMGRATNPANPLVNNVIAAIEQLQNKGTFQNLEQDTDVKNLQGVYVQNLIAGEFYLDPKELEAARQRVNEPPKQAATSSMGPTVPSRTIAAHAP